MENVAFFNPHLRKIIFKICIQKSQNKSEAPISYAGSMVYFDMIVSASSVYTIEMQPPHSMQAVVLGRSQHSNSYHIFISFPCYVHAIFVFGVVLVKYDVHASTMSMLVLCPC